MRWWWREKPPWDPEPDSKGKPSSPGWHRIVSIYTKCSIQQLFVLYYCYNIINVFMFKCKTSILTLINRPTKTSEFKSQKQNHNKESTLHCEAKQRPHYPLKVQSPSKWFRLNQLKVEKVSVSEDGDKERLVLELNLTMSPNASEFNSAYLNGHFNMREKVENGRHLYTVFFYLVWCCPFFKPIFARIIEWMEDGS